MNKKNYLKIELIKKGMSQMFDDEAKVLAYTELQIVDAGQINVFENMEFKNPLKIEGFSKGRGFAGVMKRWGFSGAPATHGVKDTHRSPGSIGAQGYGRVLPGKKMAGRYGNKKTSVASKFLGINKEAQTIYVKGAIPGGRNAKVFIYLENNEN